jgi:hypothetical protein
MSNELTPMQTFEEKVKAKLKDTIADMLPDEALAALVQRAVDERFFKPRKEQVGYNTVEKPSWFAEAVAQEAKPLIDAYIKRAFEDHREAIQAAVKAFVDQQNLALLMSAKIADGLSADMWNHAQKIVDQVRRNY